jgi:site-specific DNA recombinase
MKRAVVLLRVSSDGQTKRAGADEGYSIEVQRDGCYDKAERLEAAVVKECVGAAQSASKGIYPALRDALDFVREDGNIDYLIVYKLERFARDELTQFAALAELRTAGTELVSVTEPIDNTPQGLLSIGILGAVNAYRSRDDGSKISAGLHKKAKLGGTPTRAPIGYLNKKRWDGKNDIRYVVTDPERAPHIRWAFSAYARGRWSLRTLSDELYERGLRVKPGSNKRSTDKVGVVSLQKILRDRYYIGIVTYRGVEYDGTHEPLVDKDTFSRVQAVLNANRQSGEKHRRHPHPLKGTVFCGHCRRRLIFSRSRGNGGTYDYFMCAGRHSDRSGCPQPFLRAELVESEVERMYTTEVGPSAARIVRDRDRLTEAIEDTITMREDELADARRQHKRAERERRKLLQLLYDGKMPDDLFAEEQERLQIEIATINRTLERADANVKALGRAVDQALELGEDAKRHYQAADAPLRRQLNQAFFRGVYFKGRKAVRVEYADHYAALYAEDLGARLRELPSPSDQAGPGLREKALVELRGLEPLTSAMRRPLRG